MGVNISSNNSLAPLSIKKSHLNPIHHYSPIASAQVKSCILFAGLGADGPTKITEPILSRDHTEIMLKHVGANIHVSKECIITSKSTNLIPLDFTIPSDPSTAASSLQPPLFQLETSDKERIVKRNAKWIHEGNHSYGRQNRYSRIMD